MLVGITDPTGSDTSNINRKCMYVIAAISTLLSQSIQSRTNSIVSCVRLTLLERSEERRVACDKYHTQLERSEERRGGKECRSRWSPDH